MTQTFHFEDDNGRCPNFGEDELDGGECYYCGWGKEGFPFKE